MQWKYERTCRSRLMAARPIMVQRDLAPARANPSSITSAVNCSAWFHTCMHAPLFHWFLLLVLLDLDTKNYRQKVYTKKKYGMLIAMPCRSVKKRTLPLALTNNHTVLCIVGSQ